MLKILSVDDDHINQLIIQEFLSEYYTVSYAGSGEECLEIINDIRPDLILMDIGLPGLNGFETSRAIRKINTFKQTPIIFISAYDRTLFNDEIHELEAGFISKPFTETSLYKQINCYLITM